MKNKRKQEVSDSESSDITEGSANNSPNTNQAHKNRSPNKRLKLDIHDEENPIVNGTQKVDDNTKASGSDHDTLSHESNDSSDNCNGESVNSVSEPAKKKLTLEESVINKPPVVKSTFDVKELTPDDEIYTFQCPESYNKTNLLNMIVNFKKSNRITNSETNEEMQVEVFNTEKKFITLALPSKTRQGCLVNLPLKGHIVVQKVIGAPVIRTESLNNDTEHYVTKFPDDIKVRHPLLGADWKCHIDLANEAIQKNHLLKKKKKKAKKEKKEKKIKES